MDIKFSSNFHISKLSKIEKKLVKKRIAEIKACKNLGEMMYGRLHLLRARYAGAYSIRIGKTSRLIIFPIAFTANYLSTGTIRRKDCIIGAIICYSPNHYQSLY